MPNKQVRKKRQTILGITNMCIPMKQIWGKTVAGM